MEPAGPFWKLSRRSQNKSLDDYDQELDAPVKGPLFPRPVFIALLVVFGVALMLAVDWFALLLLNVDGVRLQMGSLNTLRVTAVLMAGGGVPPALLMFHYRPLFSHISPANGLFS